MEAGRTNQQVTMTRWWEWKARCGGGGGQMEAKCTESLQCWWSMWLVLQVAEGEREPPTSHNDSLGLMGAGIGMRGWHCRWKG